MEKKRLKNHFLFKNLPSQTAQEVLKVLGQSWKPFYRLKQLEGLKTPEHQDLSIIIST